MLLRPYLNFNGNCEEAFKFYEKCLGGKITFKITFGESPMAKQFPALADKIMHITMTVGKEILQASDAPPDRFQKPQGFSVSLDAETTDEAERVFKALSDEAKITMPIQETFWAARFGMLTDKFGTPWMVNCHKPMPKA